MTGDLALQHKSNDKDASDSQAQTSHDSAQIDALTTETVRGTIAPDSVDEALSIDTQGDAEQRLDTSAKRLERLQGLRNQPGQHAELVAELTAWLSDEPTNREAIVLLESLRGTAELASYEQQIYQLLTSAYRATSRWADLIDVLHKHIGAHNDAQKNAILHQEIASIRSTRLNDPAGAFHDWLAAFTLLPQDAALWLELERSAEVANRWENLVESYIQVFPNLTDKTLQQQLAQRIAQILDERLKKPHEAMTYYKQAAQGWPQELSKLQDMARLLRESGQHADLAEVLERIQAKLQTEEHAEKRQIWLELGNLYQAHLSKPKLAIQCYQMLIVQDPNCQEALRALVGLLQQEHDDSALLLVLDKLVELEASNEHVLDDAILHAEVARRQGAVEKAIQSYRFILQRRKEYPAALSALEDLLNIDEHQSEIIAILEPIFLEQKNYEKLARILEIKIETGLERSEEKIVLRRLGDLYENHLGQKERAFISAQLCFKADPTDSDIRMWFEKLASELEMEEQLADTFAQQAQIVDGALKIQHARRAAALYYEKLHDLDKASTQYLLVLQEEPSDEKTLESLENIYRAQQNDKQLASILCRRSELTAIPERKREILYEIATLAQNKLSDSEMALKYWLEVLNIDADDVQAFEHAYQLYVQQNKVDNLMSWLDQNIQRISDRRSKESIARRLDMMFKKAFVLETELHERKQAATIYHSILTEDPRHQQTLGHLEKQADAKNSEDIDVLSSVYERTENWPLYLSVLQKKIAASSDVNTRLGTWMRVAQIQDEKMGNARLAFSALSSALSEAPSSMEVVDVLEKIALKYTMAQELIETLGRHVELVSELNVKKHLLYRLAWTCDTQLQKHSEAIAYYQQVLKADPKDAITLAALDTLLEKNSMWSGLVDILEKRIEISKDSVEKAGFLQRLAAIWSEQLMEPESALACHKQILQILPKHVATLRSMQKLYEDLSDWDHLLQNLQEQAQQALEPEEKIRIHGHLARLYAEELNDNAMSIKHWWIVLDTAPKDVEANSSLMVLLTTEERWEELAKLYQMQLVHTQDPKEKLDINHRLGIILGEKLGRNEDALASWHRVIEQDPKNIDALRALVPLYQERAMWPEYTQALENLIALVGAEQGKDFRYLLAKALGENLGRRQDAIKLAREIRATEPHTDMQMQRLAQLMLHIEAFDEAAICLEKAGNLATDLQIKLQWLYQVADIWRDKMHKPHEARTAYEAILSASPGQMHAFKPLIQIYRETEDWRRLIVVSEENLTHFSIPEQCQILEEMRDVQADRLGEKEQAFITGCRVLRHQPENQHAADKLEDIAKSANTFEELVAFLTDTIETVIRSDERVLMWRRIGRLAKDQLKDVAQAEQALEHVIAIEPSDIATLDVLAQLGAQEERYDKQIGSLERKIQYVADNVQKKKILFEVAQIYEEGIGDADGAIRTLERVRQLDGADLRAIEEQARLLTLEKRWSELVRVLSAQQDLTRNVSELIALRLRMAHLYENELQNLEKATQEHRSVLELDAKNSDALMALERLYTHFERWSELVSILDTQANQASDNAQAIVYLTKMANLFESQFNSSRDSIGCFERILKIDASHLLALEELKRLLRATSEWERLTQILEHHIGLTTDGQQMAQMYLQMGDIFYKEMARVDKAEQAYAKAHQVQPKNTHALHALGRLYERSGNWFQALEMMQQQASILGAVAEALPVWARIGRLNLDMLGDKSAAQTAYEQALAIDPAYPSALEALREMARQAEDWPKYSGYLIKQAETTDEPEQKTELFCEIARFLSETQKDDQEAIKFYQRALGLTVNHPTAARSLADLYYKMERWSDARDMYASIAQHLDKTAQKEQYCKIFYRLGHTSELMQDNAMALTYFQKTVDADIHYLPGLEGLSRALANAQKWEDAQKVYQTIVIHHRDALTVSEIVDLQWKIGHMCAQQQQPERAYKQFEKALELNAMHGPSLRDMAHTEIESGQWDKAFAHLNLYADVAPAGERVDVLMQMGALAYDKLKNTHMAIESLERARRLGSPKLELLQALAKAYLASDHAANAVEALEQAVNLETNSKEDNAKLYVLLGQIYETKLHQDPQAIQRYNDALDASANQVEAFAAIERILSERKEWVLLESNYRAMIARTKEHSLATRIILWRSLAELYRMVLKDFESATATYEVIRKIDPGKTKDTIILAQLCATQKQRQHQAIALYHEVILSVDDPITYMKTLRKLYHAQRDFDAVYVICHALDFLQQADEEEKKLLAYLARGLPQRGRQAMTEENWASIIEAICYEPVAHLATQLFRYAPEAVTMSAKELGLKKKDLVELRTTELYIANVIRYSAETLMLPLLDMYRVPASLEGLRMMPSQPPSLMVGDASKVWQETIPKVTLFHAARVLSYLRPEFFLAATYSGSDLRNMLFGLCLVFNPNLTHTGEPRETIRWMQIFEKLPSAVLKRLQEPAQVAFAQLLQGDALNGQYAKAVEHSASKAALTLAGDLTVAGQALAEGGDGACAMPMRERTQHLVRFFISVEHLQMRRTLGLAFEAAR